MGIKKTYITFFHNSKYNHEEVPSLFNPLLREVNKVGRVIPTFYWVNDSWFSNFPMIREKYLYIFVKSLVDEDIDFTMRGDSKGNMDSLPMHHKNYVQNRKRMNLSRLFRDGNYKGYCEPPILTSFSKIEPDAVIEFSNKRDKCGIIFKPETCRGTEVEFFDRGFKPVRFVDIPELVDALPNMTKSFPFVNFG